MKRQVKKQINKSEIYLYDSTTTGCYFIRKDSPCPGGRTKTICLSNGNDVCVPTFCD